MKLAAWITHPRQGKRLPKEIVNDSWGFDGLTVPQALRRIADALEEPATMNAQGEETKPARALTENVVVWVTRTDNQGG